MNDPKAHLSRDKILKRLVDKYQPEDWGYGGDIFTDLCRAIVGQQLSNKAARTIYTKFTDLVGDPVNPQKVVRVAKEELRSCGLSYAKINYVVGMTQKVLSKETVLSEISKLDDEGVVVELTKLKGVGEWTAEMILIFSLGRPDVFSVGDLGLRTAVSRLYGVDREDREGILSIAEKWSPYRSWASRYLWASLD